MSNIVDPKAIEQLPPSVLRTIPAGTPPSNVQPNFIHPPTLVPAVLGVGASFLTLALFCFLIRLWTKLTITKKFTWDDLTCTLGFLFALTMYAGIILGCDKGALGRHAWDVHLDQALGRPSLVTDYITTVMAVPSLGLIKSTLFIQYYAIFWPLRWVRISVWIGASLSTLFYTTISIVAFVLNSPWLGESMLDGILSWHYNAFSRFSIPIGVIGMLVDSCLLVLPIKAVSTLNMRTAKKIGLIVIFLTGTLKMPSLPLWPVSTTVSDLKRILRMLRGKLLTFISGARSKRSQASRAQACQQSTNSSLSITFPLKLSNHPSVTTSRYFLEPILRVKDTPTTIVIRPCKF